ncbi:MAG: uracil phosphoribosyltransferase [Denitrobacterium sp.]|nr:uracil phosphoribosyltransferase [Denitrobacterium sp.]
MPYANPRVTLVDHPLVQHKMGILRQSATPTSQFRTLVRELAHIEAIFATADLETESYEIETPICRTHAKRIAGPKLAIVPILRAGMGMVDGVLDLVPSARVGVLGMQRNEETHEPEPYYEKVPVDVASRDCLVVDPMLATGGSAIAAVKLLRERGVDNIKVMVLVAAPVGLDALLAADDQVHIYTCAIDEGLNDVAYIVPGLGDAGDRIFGTVA